MTAIDELQRLFRSVALGLGSTQPCIDWAITRLLRNEEGDDHEVVQLASATSDREAVPLVEQILQRYAASQSTTMAACQTRQPQHSLPRCAPASTR